MSTKKLRGIVSAILVLSALVSLITGTVLYFLKYGMWFGITRYLLSNIHAFSGLLMGIAVVVHFVINRKVFVSEIKALISDKRH